MLQYVVRAYLGNVTSSSYKSYAFSCWALAIKLSLLGNQISNKSGGGGILVIKYKVYQWGLSRKK